MDEQFITVVHKDGSITVAPMTKALLFELRAHGQITDAELRRHLQSIGAYNHLEVVARLDIHWNSRTN